MATTDSASSTRPYGEAKLVVYLDTESDGIELHVGSTWYSSDGECKEARLSLQGEISEAYDLIDEASRWIWSRWKKPIRVHGPFSGA